MGRSERRESAPGLLQRLRSDIRGNTLAIMAAGLIPMIGLMGGALDMSRMYISKTRLQQACDAGALAGRKVMGSGQWAANNGAANTSALQFFDGNFKEGTYGTGTRTRAYTESSGRVTGTASVAVPMTLMQIFGSPTQTLTVVCDAEMRLPNTDVMFVIDTTGSMDQTLPGDTQSKITALRFAVKCFYETVAKEDTNANCGGTAPSGGVGNSVQIRFGFMPYATNVNVGRDLDQDWVANTWSYDTRKANWTTTSTQGWSDPVDSVGASASAASPGFAVETVSQQSMSCPASPANQTNVPGSYTYDTDPVVSGTTRTWETRTYTRVNITYVCESGGFLGFTKYLRKRTAGSGTYTSVRHTQTQVTVTSRSFRDWTYNYQALDVSGLKGGPNGWNDGLSLEVGNNGTATTVNWDGCIEERATVSQASYNPIPATALDLNIDLVPSAATTGSLWGPALPGVIWTREQSGSRTRNSVTSTSNSMARDQSYNCATPARKLAAMTAGEVENYVDALDPSGSTYHDIGIIWGARYLSPTGIFRSENEFTPRGGEIERHMIFMTDGETCTTQMNYTAYGIPWYDRRQTTDTSGSCSGSSDTSALGAQVNARFSAVCEAIKNKNITLWVVYFGTTDTTTTTRMTNCATTGRFNSAANSAALVSTFQSIANQISQLRLTR